MSKKVLVIDDEFAVRSTCARILQSAGYRILEGETLEDAVNISKTAHPDIILLDINLDADTSGIEACKMVRADPTTRNIPIIMITGSASKDDVVNSGEAGATGYILKPITKDSLLSKISDVLGIPEDESPGIEPIDLAPMPD